MTWTAPWRSPLDRCAGCGDETAASTMTGRPGRCVQCVEHRRLPNPRGGPSAAGPDVEGNGPNRGHRSRPRPGSTASGPTHVQLTVC